MYVIPILDKTIHMMISNKDKNKDINVCRQKSWKINHRDHFPMHQLYNHTTYRKTCTIIEQHSRLHAEFC